MVSAALAGMASSTASQALSGQGVNFGKVLQAGAVGAITAGLTNGITLDAAGNVGFNTGVNVAGSGTQSLASLAGVSNSSGVMQAAQGGATDRALQQVGAVLANGVIGSGINTLVYGGSFGKALETSLVTQGAALAAYAIGGKIPGIGDARATTGTEIANVLAHAALGCASSAALGTGCAGGAVGGATSAMVTPLIRDAIYADSPVLNYGDDKMRQVITVGLATLIGGTTGALLGTDATAAALAAQNESLNNATSQGPARGIGARENARLMAECGTSCTREDFNRIDTQVRQVEAAATLAKMSNLTPEQTLKLADTLSNLLPYYGSAAMLYQAVTGQTLSGQELGAADRWLSGILGAIPVGAAAYGKISEFLAVRSVTAVDPAALNTLAANGIKFTPENVIATVRTPSGQIVFLETGNSSSGLQHILERHAGDFGNKGIAAEDIPSVVMQAVTQGKIVGTNGSAPVYEIAYRGTAQYISVGIGSNGYIVRANPVSTWKPIK
jgi:filamentous hemagglutinin